MTTINNNSCPNEGGQGNINTRMVGRPTKFTTKLAEKICVLAKVGLTERQIAFMLDFNPDSLTNWKRSPVFAEMLREAKKVADTLVEQALFKRAMGMTVSSHSLDVYPDGHKVERWSNKEIPPDLVSIRFWLSNRWPEKWKMNPTSERQDLYAFELPDNLKNYKWSEEQYKKVRAILELYTPISGTPR